MTTQPRRPLYTAFLAATAMAGCGLLAARSLWSGAAAALPALGLDLGFSLLLALAARALAFRLYGRARVALDAAFYVAAAFTFGTLTAAWLVFVVLSAAALVQRWPSLARANLLEAVQRGALPALLLLLLGPLFGGDVLLRLSAMQLALQLPLFATVFLLLHYGVAGLGHWLNGAALALLWRNFVLRAVVAELFLVPLAVGMVLAHRHQGGALMVLLGGTCLLFNGVYRHAVLTRERLRRRVVELATLNKVGRLMASTLERPALVAHLARESLRLVRHNSQFMIFWAEETGGVAPGEFFDALGQRLPRRPAAVQAALAEWVMRHERPLLLGNVARDQARYLEGGAAGAPALSGSWLGVPLRIYNQVSAVMAVQSECELAYSTGHRRVLTMMADQAAVALENARLYAMATIDGLTGLFARRYFDQRLNEEWLCAARYGGPFSVGLLDVDNFKVLNDTHGHQAGDHVLRAVAAVLRSNMRKFEVAARFGGEEYAFILPRTGLSEAARVGERIRADIARTIVPFRGAALHVTVSVGIAGFPQSGALEVAQLVAHADEALYRAKRSGKNCVVLHAEGAADAGGRQERSHPYFKERLG